MNIIRKLTAISASALCRNFSVSSAYNANYSCKLVVVGGGTGGVIMANKFARRLGKGSVVIIEPSSDHYYQPLWTLVGGGIKRVKDTHKFEQHVLPSNAQWIKDRAESIDPKANKVTTKEGHVVNYEYIIVGVGLVNDYDRVPGLAEALKEKNSNVSTIFSSEYCEKTWSNMQAVKGGDVIFTYPDSPIKCPGAPQKILYLADAYLSKAGIRDKVSLHYITSLPVIFGVKKYADALLKVVEKKEIKVNYKTVLKEVRHDKKEAVFFNADDKTKDTTIPYSMLHVSPPMKTPDLLRNNSDITDAAGFLSVDKYTLQHTKYKNMFGIGDCTNTPNSKTAAAIAKQSYVLEHNLLSTMKQDDPKLKYDGYGACPLVTSYNTCIMAEFLYDGVVRETLPFDQSKESIIAFYMKRELFPFLYWNFMLKGYYHGPEWLRKLINPLGVN